MSDDRRVEKLRRDHAVENFDCGREELNRYLVRYAWQNQQAGAAQTYVGIVGEVIVGYHTLAVGHVLLEDAPERLTKGLAKHPVPGREHAEVPEGTCAAVRESRGLPSGRNGIVEDCRAKPATIAIPNVHALVRNSFMVYDSRTT